MVELALLDEEGLYASPHELTLGPPRLHVETLEHFRREMPDAELHLLIGGDSFADLHHWVRWREIAAPGPAGGPRPARVGPANRRRSAPEVAELARSDRVLLLQQPPVDVSSTRLRELLAAGVPPARGGRPGLGGTIRAKVRPLPMNRRTHPTPALDTAQRVREAVAAADDRKAVDLKVLHLQKISDFTDYFLICSGTNERQVQAIADAVQERLAGARVRPLHVEGYNRGQWVLLDYGDFVVHVFQEEPRRFYALERLWGTRPT